MRLEKSETIDALCTNNSGFESSKFLHVTFFGRPNNGKESEKNRCLLHR